MLQIQPFLFIGIKTIFGFLGAQLPHDQVSIINKAKKKGLKYTQAKWYDYH